MTRSSIEPYRSNVVSVFASFVLFDRRAQPFSTFLCRHSTSLFSYLTRCIYISVATDVFDSLVRDYSCSFYSLSSTRLRAAHSSTLRRQLADKALAEDTFLTVYSHPGSPTFGRFRKARLATLSFFGGVSDCCTPPVPLECYVGSGIMQILKCFGRGSSGLPGVH